MIKTVVGDIVEQAKDSKDGFFMIFFHPKKEGAQRFGGVNKKIVENLKVDYDYKKSHLERLEYRYSKEETISFFAALNKPDQKDLVELPVKPKWAGKKREIMPNWKLCTDLDLLTIHMERMDRLTGLGRKIIMPFPEPFTTPERSEQIMQIIGICSKNVEVWSPTPLPHLRPHRSVPKVAKTQY